ncbi:hypothetical protein AMATHDRAFT_10851 [Amanita thiersii Skay4041]|uniref:Uncharacterized protein n=1 Tax=Amanita thiersii Skay4041 TaxID=703135 RepID=A0A2A9N5U5_9AGAR|nr:hypothetical protein AMATHDRAFT_10851 [Amanita thiersii Skay4041]
MALHPLHVKGMQTIDLFEDQISWDHPDPLRKTDKKIHDEWMMKHIQDINTNSAAVDYVIFMDGSHNPANNKAMASVVLTRHGRQLQSWYKGIKSSTMKLIIEFLRHNLKAFTFEGLVMDEDEDKGVPQVQPASLHNS